MQSEKVRGSQVIFDLSMLLDGFMTASNRRPEVFAETWSTAPAEADR